MTDCLHGQHGHESRRRATASVPSNRETSLGSWPSANFLPNFIPAAGTGTAVEPPTIIFRRDNHGSLFHGLSCFWRVRSKVHPWRWRQNTCESVPSRARNCGSLGLLCWYSISRKSSKARAHKVNPLLGNALGATQQMVAHGLNCLLAGQAPPHIACFDGPGYRNCTSCTPRPRTSVSIHASTSHPSTLWQSQHIRLTSSCVLCISPKATKALLCPLSIEPDPTSIWIFSTSFASRAPPCSFQT